MARGQKMYDDRLALNIGSQSRYRISLKSHTHTLAVKRRVPGTEIASWSNDSESLKIQISELLVDANSTDTIEPLEYFNTGEGAG